MNSDDIKKIVQLYFDGELEKNKEPILFTILAESEEGREYFKQLNIINAAVRETTEEFPASLEEKIFSSIERREETKPRRNIWLPAASLSIAALMLIISLFLFFEVRDYRSKVELVSDQVRLQNKTIELILNNSLPPAEVETRRVNEIIVKANL